MKQLFFIPLLFLFSCKSSSNSKSPAEAPVPLPFIPTPAPAALSAPDELKYSYFMSCSKMGDAYYTIHFGSFQPRYSLTIHRHETPTCNGNAVARIYQEGRIEEKENSDQKSTELKLLPDAENFLFAKDLPESVKACAQTLASQSFGRLKDCMEMKESLGTRIRTDSIYALRKGQMKLDFLKVYFPDMDSTLNWALPYTMASNGVESIEKTLCHSLPDHTMKGENCQPIEYVKADPASLIEFEKGTGLHGKLIGAPVELAKSESGNFHVHYRFACTIRGKDGKENPNLNLGGPLRLQVEGQSNSESALVPISIDAIQVAVLTGPGRLILSENRHAILRLRNRVLDENCKLIIEKVEVK